MPWHNALRKAINPFFTATASVGFENLIDKTVDVFLEQWDTRFSGKKGPDGVIELPDWLLFFSFDVIGELTYGSRHGFMEKGRDSQGIIAFVKNFATYGAVVRSFVLFPLNRILKLTLSGGRVAFCGQVSSTQPCPIMDPEERYRSTQHLCTWTLCRQTYER